jgi:hypothetical protein
MENRNTKLGYLVVLDARLEDFDKPLLKHPTGAYTVICKIVDVRPRVSMRTQDSGGTDRDGEGSDRK